MPVANGFKGTNALMKGPPLCSPSRGGQGITSSTADSVFVRGKRYAWTCQVGVRMRVTLVDLISFCYLYFEVY